MFRAINVEGDNQELTAFLGEQCLTVDVNSMKPLDNLCHPVSVIREAEELAARSFWCKTCFFHGERHNFRCTSDGDDRM